MSPSASKNLPLDITEAILPLLPAKSLGRFKSVSKTWNSLISDPHFIKTHFLHNNQTSKLIALSTTGSPYSIDITETHDRDDDIPATAKELSIGSPPIQWKDILGSCNGLLLAKDEKDTIFVMNPTTQDLWKVPLCPFAPPLDDEYEKVYVVYGFGYDATTDDYKIVSISFWHPHSMQHDTCEAFVCFYSLCNNLWRKLPDYDYHEHDYTVLDLINGAVINQTLHWLSRQLEIVGFNVANEEFNEMKFPDRIGIYTSLYSSMVDVGGKLGVFMWSDAGFECCVMEEYGVAESWTKVRIHGAEKDRIPWPVCLRQGRNRDIVFQEKEGRFVLYNIDERRFRGVRIVGGPGGNVNVFGGTFVESLESPKRVMMAS